MFSNDVETTSIWHNSLRDETGLKVWKEGMPRLLDLYQKYQIKTTFFFTGHIAKLYPDIVKMVMPYGHEVASHGLSHEREDGFDVMPLELQKKHLSESKKILEDISGEEVISFRAPALRVNNQTVLALKECGFKIDSSVASQRFDMFMSFGGVEKLKWLTAPRKPYVTSDSSLFKKGKNGVVEVPVSASILPYLSTTMRIFPALTRFQRSILANETSMTGKPIVFITHPNEFIDESQEKREENKRASNAFASFLQDTVRSRLKIKNLGPDGIPIYEDHLKYFANNHFRFCTIRDYCIENSLINNSQTIAEFQP
jgi:peptidoglycan/xylan/chitin deacetylase (PgdA/CDA1 family)